MDAVQKLGVPPPDPAARRFAAATLVATTALLVTCMAAAVATDPRGEFPGQAFRPLVLDIPTEKLGLARQAAPMHAVLLGSSRGMPLPPSALPEPRAFNFAMLGGGLRDDALAYDAAVRLGGSPERVVIALDSFQLMRLPDGGDWSIVLDSASARDYLGQPAPWTASMHALPSTLSASYMRDVVQVLDYTFVSQYPAPANAFGPDGLGLRPAADQAIANGTYDLAAAFESNWAKYLGTIFTAEARADPGEADVLGALVQRAAAAGAEVDIVLPPYWHGALDRLDANPVFRQFQEAAVDDSTGLCAAHVRVFDYTRAEVFGGLPDAFYDGYHVTPENGARLLRAVAAGTGDLCAPTT